MIRLAVFDCDGTLVDSQANICLAVEEAFSLAGLEPPLRNDIRRIVGLSLVEAMRHLLPDADDAFHRTLAENYKATFFRLRSAGSMASEPLYEGMTEVLDSLAQGGWRCGVATGKSDRGLIHVLTQHGILDRFVTLQTADRHPSKPHPSMLEKAMEEAGANPAATVMIGDTSFDMAMARAAGTRAVGVAWGYHPPAELIEAGADVIVNQVRALPAELEAR